MKEIGTILESNINILFIAPTGWGKTTLLLDLMKNSSRSWVYLAPLRALANEFYLRASVLRGSHLMRTYAESREFIESGIDFKLLVITPELLTSELMNLLPRDSIFVFDEIHLFSYWGESFRPRLRECFEDVFSIGFTSLCLTATMERDLLAKWSRDVQLAAESNIVINLKNHSLKKDPKRRVFILNYFKEELLRELQSRKSKNSILIFCRYRQEVKYLEKRLRTEGFKVLSCIGGEAEIFSENLLQMPKPDFILSTSTLSHGVNLPKISSVYLSYRIDNFDFWIQMIGRAGRRGEEFTLYTHDISFLSKKELFLSFLYLLFIKLKNMI